MGATARASWEQLEINGKKISSSAGVTNWQNARAFHESNLRIMQEHYPNKMPPDVKKKYDKLVNELKYNRYTVADTIKGKQPEAIVAHEYGHILADQYFGQINDIKANANARSLVCANARQLVKDTYYKAYATGDIYNLSQYGGTDECEFFAEAFSAQEMGETLPDYISNMLFEVPKNGIM